MSRFSLRPFCEEPWIRSCARGKTEATVFLLIESSNACLSETVGGSRGQGTMVCEAGPELISYISYMAYHSIIYSLSFYEHHMICLSRPAWEDGVEPVVGAEVGLEAPGFRVCSSYSYVAQLHCDSRAAARPLSQVSARDLAKANQCRDIIAEPCDCFIPRLF